LREGCRRRHLDHRLRPQPAPGAGHVRQRQLERRRADPRLQQQEGGGLLALYNEASGKKGLARTLYDAGNTDTLVLATVDQTGRLVTLKTVSLGAAIAENVWYRVSMDVAITGSVVSVTGTVFRHQTPTDPDSALTAQVGPSLTFSAALGVDGLTGVDATGEVGILSAAVSAANSSSVTRGDLQFSTGPNSGR
jgi:hypothetical protein